MCNYDDMWLGVGNSDHPANQENLPDTEVTIDESYYYELKQDSSDLLSVKKLFKEWYKLNSFPLEKTSEEKVKLAELENQLIKILL